VIAQRPRVGLLRDIFNGAFRGDFAEDLGLAGIVTQILLGYVPVVGTLCAIRDYLADRRSGDRLGVWLNILAVIPVFGGFPKTAEVLEHTLRVVEVQHGLAHLSHRAETSATAGPEAGARQKSRTSTAFMLGLMAPFVMLLLGLGVAAVAVPLWHVRGARLLGALLGAGFVVPLMVVIRGHVEWSQRKSKTRTGVLPGLVLGYLYLILMLVIASVALLAYQAGAFH
jgi:hypothetical protein